jgi:RecA/RadA recombinase
VVDKLAALKKITDKINKEVTKVNPDAPPVAFIAAGHEDLLDFGLIPTGNTAVDEALGGGFPRGTIVQIVGQEGAGKTCVCFDMIAYNQRIAREKGEQFVTIYVHLEARAFPLLPAINAGVDLDLAPDHQRALQCGEDVRHPDALPLGLGEATVAEPGGSGRH